MSVFDIPSEIRDIINTVAPTIATALGGPLAGTAVRTLSEVLIGSSDASVDELNQAIRNATPEQLLQIKKAEQQFQVKMRELEISVEQLHQKDRASAREREVRKNDNTNKYLAFCITVGFFGILGWMLLYGLPLSGGEALLLMLGSLGTAWISIISYYFGSSAGSKQKNEQIEQMINNQTPSSQARNNNGPR